jgi:5-formyltetrahydrofolate cyclo-ligase
MRKRVIELTRRAIAGEVGTAPSTPAPERFPRPQASGGRMTPPEEIKALRRAERARLVAEREALPLARRQAARGQVWAALSAELPALVRGRTVAFYWPFRGEIDLVGFVSELVRKGTGAALPVVAERGRPLAFRRWEPGMELRPGVWGIPVPTGEPVAPDCLLVPLVGFDDAGHRLGYGGGYYDRTLAAASPRPLAIGVGYAFQRLPTLHPQPHDQPMDAIVTEEGLVWHRRPDGGASAAEDRGAEPIECSSPPCYLGEL